jgi:hypothetical protein
MHMDPEKSATLKEEETLVQPYIAACTQYQGREGVIEGTSLFDAK